jgi:hypothetical protein
MLAILAIFGKKEKFYAVVEDDNNSSTPVETVKAPVNPSVVEAPPEAPKTTKAPVKSKSVKSSKKTGKKGESATTATVAPKRAVAPEPFWVKAMENTRNYPKPPQEGTQGTFSPDYLLPKPSNTRRRPGPSLNPFLNMARQIGGRGSI